MIDIVGTLVAVQRDGFVIYCIYRDQYFFLKNEQIASDKLRVPEPCKVIFDSGLLLE